MLKIFCNFRRLCYNEIAEKKALLRLRADFANKSFSFLFLMSRRKAVFLLYNIKNKKEKGDLRTLKKQRERDARTRHPYPKDGPKGKARLKEINQTLYEQNHRNTRSQKILWILRVLVMLTMCRQFVMHNYEGVAICVLSLVLMILPGMAQAYLKVVIPQALEIFIYLFIYAAEILGEVNQYYTKIPFWDTILHTMNGFVCAAVGFSLVLLLNADKRTIFKLSPVFVSIVSFCFSMTIGVCWEFFEFTMDYLFGCDMQKDTVVHTIKSVALDPGHHQRVMTISGITKTVVNGKVLPIHGYLDIGLIDTMGDLFVNFIGAAVFCTIGYFALKGRQRQRLMAEKLLVVPEEDEAFFGEMEKQDEAAFLEAHAKELARFKQFRQELRKEKRLAAPDHKTIKKKGET